MKKFFANALLAVACGAMMASCCGKSQNDVVAVDSTAEVAVVVDTVRYVGNGFETDSQAEYMIVADQLVSVKEGDKVYENLNAEVFYGETMPEELNSVEEGTVVLCGSVMDRMNHGEKNNCWIKVVGR